jgi:hypothetical protein
MLSKPAIRATRSSDPTQSFREVSTNQRGLARLLRLSAVRTGALEHLLCLSWPIDRSIDAPPFADREGRGVCGSGRHEGGKREAGPAAAEPAVVTRDPSARACHAPYPSKVAARAVLRLALYGEEALARREEEEAKKMAGVAACRILNPGGLSTRYTFHRTGGPVGGWLWDLLEPFAPEQLCNRILQLARRRPPERIDKVDW